MKNLDLGDEVKDRVTGFTGIIVGHARYLTGCDQYNVQPQCDPEKPGVHPDGYWFDEGKLELLKTKVVTMDEVKAEKKGCDVAPPSKM